MKRSPFDPATVVVVQLLNHNTEEIESLPVPMFRKTMNESKETREEVEEGKFIPTYLMLVQNCLRLVVVVIPHLFRGKFERPNNPAVSHYVCVWSS